MLQKIKNYITNAVDRRTCYLYINILVSFLVKGWSALVVLIMVPLTLKCLGTYQNGVWLTVSSLLVWIDQMDIGLGNGLRNRLASHMAKNETHQARIVISSTMAMLAFIVLPILVLLSLLIWYTDVYSFLNVIPERLPALRPALLAAVVLVCITFILKFIGNVYMGMQLPAVSNLLIALGQTIALIATWILFHTYHATFFNVVVVNTAAPLFVYLMAYPYTFFKRFPMLRPSVKLIKLKSALELGNLGIKFFWLQLAAIIQFMTANILISKFFSPAMVTPYQIAYRYMSLVLVFFTIVVMPFWNATTDAYERGDIHWIRISSNRLNKFLLIVFAIIIILVIISPYVYSIWIGEECQIPTAMTILTGLYIYLLIVSSKYAFFLNGIGALRIQLLMTVSAIIFIPLQYLVSVLTHNITFFLIVMCILNIPGLITNIIQFNKILNGTAKGFWKI